MKDKVQCNSFTLKDFKSILGIDIGCSEVQKDIAKENNVNEIPDSDICRAVAIRFEGENEGDLEAVIYYQNNDT